MPVVALEQKAQIYTRLVTLKDYSPFILITDTLAQTAAPVLREIVHHAAGAHVVRINFEHHPGEERISPGELAIKLPEKLKTAPQNTKVIVMVDNLGMLPDPGRAVQSILRPGISVIGVLHTDVVTPPSYGPSVRDLLDYMATSLIEMVPTDATLAKQAESSVAQYDFDGFNPPVFRIQLTHRRRSGRAVAGTFEIDSVGHTSKFVPPQAAEDDENPELLAGLTTFNLSTSSKSKADREKVDLPFLDAQEVGDGGKGGGAIIYQFEKDDDYDEEDPYEDPF